MPKVICHVVQLLQVLIACLLSVSAHAYRPENLPNLFNDNPSLTVPHIILGRACYSLPASQIDLNCNPALLAHDQKQVFRANLVGNDRMQKLNDYRIMISENDGVGVANDLLAQKAPLIAKGAASFWYQNDWWAIGYAPIKMGVAYLVENPTYPRISVLGYRDSELFGQIGLLVSSDERLSVGLNVRAIRRDFVFQQFDAFDAFDNQNIASIYQQNILYVDPGFSYLWNSAWNPSVTWSVNNVALVQNGARLHSEPVIDVGIGADLFGWQRFRHTLHMTVGSHAQSPLHRILWAGRFSVNDIVSTYFSLGADQFGVGLQGQFMMFTTGLGYRSDQIATSQWSKRNVSSFIFDLGLTF